MKILFLVKRFYTNKDLIEDEFGRLYYFPAILAADGYDCSVFALDFRNKRAIDVRKDNVRFRTIPVRSLWRPSLLLKNLRALKMEEADVVFASGDSYIGYLGVRLAKRLSAKAVFDLYDDYAYFATNRIPGMRALLRKTLRKSNLVVCASESLEQKYRVYQSNTVVVQNGVDGEVFKAEEKHTARRKSKIPDDAVVVGYFGSIHKPRGADDLIAAVELLRSKENNVTLLMAGNDHGEVDLARSWIDYRGMVEQKDVVALINSCNVVTIPYKDTELMRMTNACKLMEYIACGVPVVVSDVADYASYFPDHRDCVSEPGNPASLAHAIENQLRDQRIAKEQQVVSWRNLVSRLDAAIGKS